MIMMLSLSSFYRWQIWGSGRLTKIFKVSGVGWHLAFSFGNSISSVFCSLPPFFFFFRERCCMHAWGQREREKEYQACSTPSPWNPMRSLNSWTVKSWSESKSRVRHLTHGATQAPLMFYVNWNRYWKHLRQSIARKDWHPVHPKVQ